MLIRLGNKILGKFFSYFYSLYITFIVILFCCYHLLTISNYIQMSLSDLTSIKNKDRNSLSDDSGICVYLEHSLELF